MSGIKFTEGQEDYDNEKVKEISDKLGEFNYDEEPNHGDSAVEARAEVILENHAKYEGEWIVG